MQLFTYPTSVFAKMNLFHFHTQPFHYELIKILIFFSFLISCANSQNDTITTLLLPNTNDTGIEAATATATATAPATSTTTNTTTPGLIPCGNTQEIVDECFRDLPPHLMEFLQTTKIAINEREIASKCTIFKGGMKCFENYTERCMEDKKISLFKNNVEGARKFFMRFCGDREFQKDYLRHKDCFSYIQPDWIRCTKGFQSILTDELHDMSKNITDKFFEFCCARYAYENCIYNSARYKCYKNSANFARETAKMLSDEKHFTNCRQYEKTLCELDHGHSLGGDGRWLFLLLLWVQMIDYVRRQHP